MVEVVQQQQSCAAVYEASGRGADSKTAGALQSVEKSLDGIIDTVSAQHPLMPFLSTLKTDGKLVLVGAAPEPLAVPASASSAVV